MRSLAVISILVVLALTACSSDSGWKRHPSVSEEFNGSSCVFVGEVVSDRQLLGPDHFIQGTFYTIRVQELLKGAPRELVEVYDENSSGRFPMRAGVRYLLFAYEGAFEGVNGPRLAINNCGNSGTLKELGEVLATARKLKQTKAQPKD